MFTSTPGLAGRLRARRLGALLLALALLAGALAGLAPERPGVAATREGRGQERPRIVGGTPVPEGMYRFATAIALRASDTKFCGGSLIAPEWVLTAAHCVDGREAAELTAFVGANGWSRRNEAGQSFRRDVAEIVVNPLWYTVESYEYDSALLRLQAPVPGAAAGGVDPVALPVPGSDLGLVAGQELTVVGWGRTSQTGPVSDRLMQVAVPVQPDGYCQERYRLTDAELAVMFCAGPRDGGQDSCQGDSGGPIFLPSGADPQRYTQVGIVSWGNGCALAGYPGVYARIAAPAIDDFIRRNVALPSGLAPAVAIEAPAADAAISAGAALAAGATGTRSPIAAVGFARCAGDGPCAFDDAIPIAVDTAAPFAAPWPETPAGPATLAVRAWDLYGNAADAERAVLVENPPTVAIASPKPGQKVKPEFTIEVAAGDAVSGVARVVLQDCVSGTCFQLEEQTSAPWTFQVVLPKGTHVLQATAFDGAGNAGVSAPVKVTVGKKKK